MNERQNVSVVSYVVGFVLAVGLTLLAYGIVVGQWFTGATAIAAVMSLAIVQLVVQLVFFLHVGRGHNAKWNVTSLLFTLLILVVVVAGSLWIMYNLNYNMEYMMTPEEMNQYMIEESKKGF